MEGTKMMSDKCLNVVLLGGMGVGKSASGNTILGRHAFNLKKNSSVTRDVAVESGLYGELHITVHDTPGFSGAESKEELGKYEEVLQKCESDLCVFLLVIKAGIFPQEEQEIVKKIEELLGEKRLKNTWILFTRGDQLEDENKTINKVIEENEALRKLIQKYESRFHVFNNKDTEGHGSKKTLQRISINIQDIPASSLSSRLIVLLGKSGVGKSAAGNTILGQKKFTSTMRMNSVTCKYSDAHVTVSSRSLSVVDTPGFFDTKMNPEELTKEIARSVYLSSHGPRALRVDNRFTEQELKSPQQIEMMFGQDVLKYSILFSRGDQLEDESVEELMKENSRFRDLVDQCGGRFHIFNNKDQNNREQVNDLLQKIDSMIEQNGGGLRREEEEQRKQQEKKQRQEEIDRVKKETREEYEAEQKSKGLPSRFSALCSEDQENTETFIMATADKLLERIFCMIEEKERFADNLKELAEELESLRKKSNVGEYVGSSLKVLGAVGMIVAGVVTFLTGGAVAPLFGLACTGIGATITEVTKIIKNFYSSTTMKKVQNIEKKSNKIAKEIQQLFQKLKSEQKEANPLLKPDELEHHIMAEIPRAIARHSGLNVQINDSMLNEMLQESPLEKISGVHSRGACGGSLSAGTGQRSEEQFGDRTSISDTKSSPQMIETCLEKPKMLVNLLLPSGVLFLSAVLIFIDHKGKAKLSDAVLQLLGSTGFLAGVMVAGGAAVLTFALPGMIDNAIKKITQKLKKQLKRNKKMLEKKSEEIKKKLPNLLGIVLVVLLLILQKLVVLMLQRLQKNKQKQQIEEEESSEEEDPPAVNVGLLNVRSIKDMKEKRLKIKKLITENNLDVFLLTETWLENDTADEALRETVPPNFKFHQQSREDKRGGGVTILVSNKLNNQRINFNLSPTTFEYVATALKHDEWDEKVLFINVYQPPTNTIAELEIFVGDFDMLLRNASKCYNRIIVAGDFNIHFEDPSNEKKKAFEAACMSTFVQHVEEPTHKKGGILDLVFSRNVKVSSVHIRDDGISDHFTVYFSIKAVKKMQIL